MLYIPPLTPSHYPFVCYPIELLYIMSQLAYDSKVKTVHSTIKHFHHKVFTSFVPTIQPHATHLTPYQEVSTLYCALPFSSFSAPTITCYIWVALIPFWVPSDFKIPRITPLGTKNCSLSQIALWLAHADQKF